MAHYSSWNHHDRYNATEETSRLRPPTRHTTSMESTTNRTNGDYLANFPILSSFFVSDGKKTAIVDPSPANQLLPYSIGQLQCDSLEDVTTFNECRSSPTSCQRSTTVYSAHCECPNGNMTSYLSTHHVFFRYQATTSSSSNNTTTSSQKHQQERVSPFNSLLIACKSTRNNGGTHVQLNLDYFTDVTHVTF
ncbi:unnamed protein product [Haemonchus placei]|uniref:Phlebovirus_G2 domain-containing protein n=1 Tax=Haemonchus placei TaxID=6290 RepID=A0A0N4W868_HAEPC|nr:unnamed protein product [Haemonchus placei]